MSSTTVSQLKELLEKLEALNVQEPNPQLESQLAAVVAAAQAEIDHQQRRENDPKVQLESLGAPEDLRPLSSTADMNLSGMDGDNPELQIAHQAVPRPHFRVKTNSCLPFLAIEMEGGSDPRDAFLDRNQPPQFGTPLIGVHPLEPPLDLFVWPEASMSTEGKPAHDKLEPAPSMKAPFIGYFPQAPVYMLNSERDRSHRRGWRYAAPFYTSDREEQKQNMLNVRMPDNVAPTHFDTATRSFVASPIPGMIRAPLGIPLVHHIHGDAKRAVTAVCVHTLETVMQYPQGPEIHELARQLVDLTWGQDPSGDRPLQYGIFEIPGMKTNLRSKHVGNAPAGDGSFNIASTHGEGEGFGHFGPAVQTDTAEAAPIKSILKILHRLYRLVMPLCISRFEWEFMELNGYENNVLAFGGLEPGPTSCQVNSSSAANVVDLDVPSVEEDNVPLPSNPSRRARVEEVDDEDDNPSSHLHPTSSFVILEEIETESPPTQDVFTLIDLTDLIYTELKKAGALDTSIGTQGKPHGDFKDDPGWFTLFVLQFRLPPGSDMGPFLWMQSAICVRETDQYILFMAFKGQDIHTGSAPTYIKRFMDDFPSSDLGNKLFK
ncbi:hypothetical protein K438DRAFT_1986728 [Mycena galopus ATCC 62051]|nr:hypothetical protein K438DRAFT_1986728 [Mycena galopus ATCC 62051]